MQHLIESAGESRRPAADMADLAEVIRTLLAAQAGRDTRVRLGGSLFDVVITSSGPQAHGAAALMDAIQGRCGPVIEDPASGRFHWLVPPGSSTRWQPHTHAVCLGSPHTITLPPLDRTAPPGPYWFRPPASDRLVPIGPLRKALTHTRPEPTPHTTHATQAGTTT